MDFTESPSLARKKSEPCCVKTRNMGRRRKRVDSDDFDDGLERAWVKKSRISGNTLASSSAPQPRVSDEEKAKRKADKKKRQKERKLAEKKALDDAAAEKVRVGHRDGRGARGSFTHCLTL